MRAMRVTGLAVLAWVTIVSAAQAYFGFGPASGSPFGASGAASAIAVGDFNGDGHPDLVTAGQGGDLVVLLNDGTGQFSPASYSPQSSLGNIVALTTGEVDGDTLSDVAYVTNDTNNDTGSLVVRQGSPSGLILGTAPLTVTAHSFSPRFGDFNGDGKPDLIVANEAAGTLSEFLNNGMGAFSPASASPINVGGKPWAIGVGDFNGDHKQDLAVGDINSPPGNLRILLGDGTGGFIATGAPLTVGSSPYSIAVTDVNGDGKLDLAVANESSANVSVLLGDGAGGFTAAPGSPFAVGSGPFSVATGDFNGDGKPDLVTADHGSDHSTVLLGDGHGGFTAAPGSPFSTGPDPWSVAVADFNGDGLPDFATADQGAPPTTASSATVWLNASRPVPALSASVLPFGSTLIGTSSAVRMVSLGSSADAALLVSSVSVTGPDAPDFTIRQDSCTGGRSLAGGAPCSVAVQFAPTSPGSKSATLSLIGNAGTTNVSLTGTGVTTSSGPAQPPTVRLDSASAIARGVTDEVSCVASTGSCTTVETLTTVETTVGKKVVALSASRRRSALQRVGARTVSIGAGRTATVTVSLNHLGRSLLMRFHRLPVRLRVAVKIGGRIQTSHQKVLTIKAQPRRRK